MKTPTERALGESKQEIQAFLDEAIARKDWITVKNICEMPDSDPKKPNNANKGQILRAAIDQKQWEDVFNIEQTFKNKNHELVQGPLLKSSYTKQFEELARRMMQPDGGNFTLEQKDGNDFFVFQDGTRYNWTEIREHTNFQHITLNEEDFKSYKTFMEAENRYMGYTKGSATDARVVNLNKDTEAHYRAELYKASLAEGADLPDPPISLQEMQAINVYTGSGCYYMNQLLRGYDDPMNPMTQKNPSLIRESLIQSAMCASGLRKLPKTHITKSYRGTIIDSDDRIAAHLTAAATQGIVNLQGFVSSTTNENSDFLRRLKIKYTFTNLTGIYLDPISATLPFPENEFLIPPTQVRITGYEKRQIRTDGGETEEQLCFTAECVSDLSCLSAESLDTYLNQNPDSPLSSYDLALKELEKLVMDLYGKSKSDIGNEQFLAANELLQSLKLYSLQYFVDKTLSKDEYIQKSETAINTAINSPLAVHDNFIRRFLESIKSALHKKLKSFCEVDFFEPTPTKEIQLTTQFKKQFDTLKDSLNKDDKQAPLKP